MLNNFGMSRDPSPGLRIPFKTNDTPIAGETTRMIKIDDFMKKASDINQEKLNQFPSDCKPESSLMFGYSSQSRIYRGSVQ